LCTGTYTPNKRGLASRVDQGERVPSHSTATKSRGKKYTEAIVERIKWEKGMKKNIKKTVTQQKINRERIDSKGMLRVTKMAKREVRGLLRTCGDTC